MKIISLIILLVSILASPFATASDPAVVSAIAQYSGPDRAQRLLEGTKREGELTLYTSLTVEDMTVINEAFEKKYGVKVKMWRAGADKVLQRAVTEANGNRFVVDVAEVGTMELEALHREKLLVAVKSPFHADLIPQAVPAHHEWVASRLNVFVHAYNTSKLKKEDRPKTYQDLLQPKWKGKLGIEAADEDWFATLVSAMGEEKGLKLFRDISASNGFSVRKGHTLLTNLVAAGDVPFALTVYNFTAEQVKQKGAPLDWYVMPPAVARANGLAVARQAPHPHAAILYYDFMISEEGQQILAKRDFVTTSSKIQSPLGQTPLKLVDPAQMLDESEKWTRLYSEIIVNGKK